MFRLSYNYYHFESLFFLVTFILCLSPSPQPLFVNGWSMIATSRIPLSTVHSRTGIKHEQSAVTLLHSSTSVAVVTQSSDDEKLEESLTGTKSLGVDFGLRRTGVAVTIGYAPTPLRIITGYHYYHVENNTVVTEDNNDERENITSTLQSNNTILSKEVLSIASSEKVDQIIVGLPLYKNGTLSEQCYKVMDFCSVLSCLSYAQFGPDFPIYLFDERYSSKEAEARIRSNDKSGKINSFTLSGTLDADSACIILEHFYYALGEGKRRVHPPPLLISELDKAWQQTLVEKEIVRKQYLEDRESRLNARQEAMERARLFEQQQSNNSESTTTKKKKKKKKKKKR